jgi:hypothetical protein
MKSRPFLIALFPPSGPATVFSNGLHPKCGFLAMALSLAVLLLVPQWALRAADATAASLDELAALRATAERASNEAAGSSVATAGILQKNGFAFGIAGIHPLHPWLTGPAPGFVDNAFGPANEPIASALRQGGPVADAPPWYRKRTTWLESWDASRAAAAAQAKAHPAILHKSPILRQNDGPRHVRLKVSGMQQLVLICTIGDDMPGTSCRPSAAGRFTCGA